MKNPYWIRLRGTDRYNGKEKKFGGHDLQKGVGALVASFGGAVSVDIQDRDFCTIWLLPWRDENGVEHGEAVKVFEGRIQQRLVLREQENAEFKRAQTGMFQQEVADE